MNKKNGALSKLYVILVLLFTYLPVLVVVIYSFNNSKYGNWAGFTLSWYEKLFKNRQILRSLENTLILAFSSCFLSILIGTAGAVGMAKSRFKTKGLMENVSMIPMMLPEIILGMAYLAFFSILKIPFGMLTLIIAHTTFCVPYIYINVQSRLVGLDPSFVEAARDLGASPTKAFLDVTLPLISPAVLSGALLALAMSMDDVVISFFVTGTTSNTLPLQVYSMLKMGVTPEVNALCTLILVVVFGAIGLYYLFTAILRARAEKR